MNFRPTTLKIILSIIIGAILGIWISSSIVDCPRTEIGSDGVQMVIDCNPSGFSQIFLGSAGVLVVYLLWSLFQKK